MNKNLIFACGMVGLTLFFLSCHEPQQIASKTSKKPKFIDGIFLGGHGNTKVMDNGVDNNYSSYHNAAKVRGLRGNENSISYADNDNKPNPNLDPSITNALTEKYSGLLQVNQQSITNYLLYKFIDEWYGVAYRLGGSTKKGIDCSAFVQKLYMEVFGIDLFRTATEQFNNCIRIARNTEAQEGDLVFFKVHGRRISHVGIYLMNDYFVHASLSQGIVISSLNDKYWSRYFAGIGRLPRV